MVLAWIGAALIGLSLGLLGSGGSILTVPVLVYLAGEPDKVAIAESLAIVGAIALAGSIPYAFGRSIDWRSALYFGLPGIAGTYGGAALSQFVPGPVQLALFAVVMLAAAAMMFRSGSGHVLGRENRPQASWKIILEGVVVGIITGLVGVGGGFLIVPALVIFGGLPMRLAVGTSLLIIAAKSFAGFAKYVDVLSDAGLHVNWNVILLFTAIGIAGSFAGEKVGGHVRPDQLRRIFAFFLVLMGGFILWQELPKFM